MNKLKFSELTFKELNELLSKLTINEKDEKFDNIEEFLKLNNDVFFMVFKRQSDNLRKKLLTDERICKRILLGKENRLKRIPIELLTDEEQDIILNKSTLFLELEEVVLIKVLEKLTITKKYNLEEKILENILNKEKINPKNSKLNYIKNILAHNTRIEELQILPVFETPENFIKFVILARQGKRNPIRLLEIKTPETFNFFTKTNCVLQNDELKKIPVDIIEKLNIKHFSNLIELYIEKSRKKNINISELEIIITVLNIYLIFEYDNARKILLDFFTYPTEKSKIEQAELEFTEQRKEYRLTHQDEFYNHKMIKDILEEIKKISKGIINLETSSAFQKILNNTNKEDYQTFYEELLTKLEEDNNYNDSLKEFIKEKINQRENKLKQIYIEKTKDQSVELNFEHHRLYNIFSYLDYSKIKIDSNGNPIIDKALTSFLLGNQKRNNDCLLRMILSKNIFSLQEHLIHIINKFDIIKQEIRRSKGILSLNSVSDVINIYELITYTLDYDEQDLSLATIAKINKSYEFIENENDNIVEEMLNYHKLRKWKTYLTIPTIQGRTEENIEYEILNNDDEKLLTAGIDHHTCFKAGAKGEDFFKFCLTNPNGGVIYLNDRKNIKHYVVPFIVNGNTIYGNGIEPALTDEKDAPRLIKAIENCYKSIMKKTITEPIEIGVLTELNIKKAKQLEIKEQIKIPKNPANIDFYCDLVKPELSCYILIKKEDSKQIEHYERKSIYEQSRNNSFYYTKDDFKQIDTKKLETAINLIYYTYLKLNNTVIPQTFTPISIKECEFIIGNKDWFIIKNDDRILKCVLPYYKDIDVEIENTLNKLEIEEIGAKEK